ncbi:exophilin-5 isoform X2 [Trachypithecus francoisi]|uniref:exophilin-5 isoform X2 n=1 Tax=Trachypithecus francoisi TaxID=54180 RepID=UPI00141BA4DD|nr:exophilin-5 isoform X2 [Trachypithecus francoisi]
MPVTSSFPTTQIFLNDEEARKILQVLERNEELQRAEKDRISKLQKTKRDIRWLQGVTGEWFEEIQRKKFCNETDVSQMLKQPLTYRLRKEMAKNDPIELPTSRSKNVTNQKKPTPFSSRMSFRSSFASLFSFRKSGKETSKLPSLGQKGCDGHAGPPVPVRGAAVQAKIYSSPLENQLVDSAFVPKPAVMREESGMPPPWDASLLENEFFQVLDDLDSKLAQEQSASSVNTRTPLNYGSRTQFSHFYSSDSRHGNITERHKKHYNETSNTSIYDILRPGTPREGFKTFSPRTRTIYDMYRTREPRVFKEDYVQKNTFGSTSLCFDSRQRSALAATGHFTARSLHFPATTQNKSGFIPPRHQQSPKRTPLSSIMWNRSDSSRDRENLRAPSPMEIDPADKYVYPRGFQENRRYESYHSQNVYQRVSLNVPVENAMSPDTFENSENMPFYHQSNPFARSFFSNTFGQSGEQRRFGQSPFWSQQKGHSFWSDFHQSRKSFSSSDRDFEMISMEANSASAIHGHSVSSEHWESFSSGYGTDVSRVQEEPHPWQFDFQTSTLESMAVSHGNETKLTPHFGTPNVCSMTGSSYHVKSGELVSQQDSSPVEVHINKEASSFGIAQTLASSFKTSFPQISDDRRNPQSPNLQNPTVTLQKIIPNKPASHPMRSHTEVTVTNSNSIDSLPLAKSQPNILVTEVNNEKDLNESISEEDKQLSKMDQTNKADEVPQPVSQRGISNSLPDFQNPFSQDSAKSNRFGFSASTTVSSKKSPRVFSRKDTSKMYTLHKDKSNDIKQDKRFTENRKLGSTASLPFILEHRTPLSFPRTDQGCHQELTVSNEDISSIITNNHWSSAPTDIQNAQSPEKPVILDTEGEQCATIHSTNCGKLTPGHKTSCDSLDLSSAALPDSSPSNNSSLDAPVVPSTTVFSRRSPSDKDPSLGEREEKDNAGKNQKNQFILSHSENQERNDSHVPTHDEVVDVKCHSHSPFRNERGKGKIRHHISCIEKLSKTESISVPTSDHRSLIEANQSNSKVSELDTIYCTLPRKSSSFLIHGRQSGSKIMAASLRNGPPPFQIKNNVEDAMGNYTLNKFSPSSPESVNECSKVISDSALEAPEATERMTNVKSSGSTSVRKGPLPFLINRAMSCPSGEPHASTGREERKKPLTSGRDASELTPRAWERIISPVESDSSVRDCSLTKRHHRKENFQECTEKEGKMAASRRSVLALSNEDPLPFCSDLSGKERGKTLHKVKTTSTFSVSGDEDNVKCLEVVSIYYTLPRKPSKKFCNLLQQYTQNTNSLTESPQVETETFPHALEKDEQNYFTREQSGTPSCENLKMSVNSDQTLTTENMTAFRLSNRGPLVPTLQEMASVEAAVSLPEEESKAREIFSDNLAKTPLGDSENKKERGKKLQSETLHTLLMLQRKNVSEEKSENCQQSINSSNSGPSSLPALSEVNIGNSQARRNSWECTGSGRAIPFTESGKCPQKDHTSTTVGESSSGSQPREGRGDIRTNCQKMTNKTLSHSESQVFALTPALHKLQLGEETQSDEPNLESLQSEPRELPQRSQEANMTESRKAEDEMQKSAWDQPSLPEGNNKNKTNSDDLVKGENRSSVKHRLAVVSKANRKFPAKDVSPRRHVATIFPQSGGRSGFDHLSLGTLECNPLFPEPTPKSADSIGESRLSEDGKHVKKSENPLTITVLPSREPSTHVSNQKSNSISQRPQNEFKNVSESPSKLESSKDVTVAENLERESGAPSPITFTSLREAEFSDDQRRLSPPFPLEPAQKSRVSIPLASFLRQQRSASSLEWEPEPHLYRSKSLKSINMHGDLLRKSHPPKVRERHFSESTSIDNALSRLTLGNEFSVNNGYSRRFRSFSELPSYDGNESWAYRSSTKTGPRSATSIYRPIDYGIFGKEQQLAFLENVKRSLTQGRLWKPSFLKNPGFLKDDLRNPPNPSESLSSNSPCSQMPEDGLSPSEPLNIYEDDPVDSDCDTDTTTDDEYYLDENDKESEL